MSSKETEWDCVIMGVEAHPLRLSATIQNILDLEKKPGLKLESPQMECNRRCGVKWTMEVYPYGKTVCVPDFFGILLKMVDKASHVGNVSATFKMYILEKDGSKQEVVSLHNVDEEDLRRGVGVPNWITKNFVKGDHNTCEDLVIRCEGKEFHHKVKPTPFTNNPSDVSLTPATILKTMYLESVNCDVTLKSGSSEFKCHKAILAVTSAYFKVMFRHDLEENRENEVDLSKDLNEEELKTLLDYIYLGKREIAILSQASLQTLYRLSQMYEIDGLQEVCEMELIRKLTLENARELIVFAITYCAKISRERLRRLLPKIVLNNLCTLLGLNITFEIFPSNNFPSF